MSFRSRSSVVEHMTFNHGAVGSTPTVITFYYFPLYKSDRALYPIYTNTQQIPPLIILGHGEAVCISQSLQHNHYRCDLNH